MAYICEKPKGACESCGHYRFDEDYGNMACFAAQDERIPAIAGKRIYTEKDFDCATAQVGDLVTEQVVDNFMNTLPPTRMSYTCSQLGEPYSHMKDPESGRIMATYVTFRGVTGGIWMYCGHCFAGENIERGEEIPHV